MNQEQILEAVEKATEEVLTWHQDWLDRGFSWQVDATSQWKGEQNVYASIEEWLEEELTGVLIGDDPMQLERYLDRFRNFVEEMVCKELEPADYEGDWIEDNFDLWTDCSNRIIAGVMEVVNETKTENAEMVEIEISERLQKLMVKYKVNLREDSTSITHQAYDTTTAVSPSVNAAYECAIKANYVEHMLSRQFEEWSGVMGYFMQIQDQSKPPMTDLPWINDKDLEDGRRQRLANEAAQDYNFCANLIAEAGLYGSLLD